MMKEEREVTVNFWVKGAFRVYLKSCLMKNEDIYRLNNDLGNIQAFGTMKMIDKGGEKERVEDRPVS